MGWKEKLNLMSNNSEIGKYLKGLGFYEAEMSPRFLTGFYNNIQNKGAKCLRLDTEHEDCPGGILRIFVSTTEIYVELQNGYRSLEWNRYAAIERDITVTELDEKLDYMMS